MTRKPERDIDWSLATWKGSRLQQHREFHALPFSSKLEIIEELGAMAAQFGGASKAAVPAAALREDQKPCEPRRDERKRKSQ